MTDSLLARVRRYHPGLGAIRRDIHSIQNSDWKNSAPPNLVARKLAEWGVEVHCGLGATGAVGVLRNRNGVASISSRTCGGLPRQSPEASVRKPSSISSTA